MKQAKTLTQAELKRVLAVANAERHAERNKLAILLSFYAGLRVKEIAALTVGDVFTATGGSQKLYSTDSGTDERQ